MALSFSPMALLFTAARRDRGFIQALELSLIRDSRGPPPFKPSLYASPQQSKSTSGCQDENYSRCQAKKRAFAKIPLPILQIVLEMILSD
jgi:hypothetical protein